MAEVERIAETLLAVQLPRRWSHVQMVAAKSQVVGVIFPDAERSALVTAAWLHDIGYAPALMDSRLHALDGARWLRNQGFDERVAGLVAYHSCALFEAAERGLVKELSTEFADEESPVRDALWYADMTTGPDGQDMSVEDRLAEVRRRYGPDHLVTRFWARAELALMEAVRRTEERLRAARIQPM